MSGTLQPSQTTYWYGKYRVGTRGADGEFHESCYMICQAATNTTIMMQMAIYYSWDAHLHVVKSVLMASLGQTEKWILRTGSCSVQPNYSENQKVLCMVHTDSGLLDQVVITAGLTVHLSLQ